MRTVVDLGHDMVIGEMILIYQRAIYSADFSLPCLLL